ncbi:MAG TPA: hypothetical protein VK475_07055 [Pyrinomonadaceae bacterium]|nr:hypothetical protein [Pyrinomonadaceae bacterium]
MRTLISLLLVVVLSSSMVLAQSGVVEAGATKAIQGSQSTGDTEPARPVQKREYIIRAGTSIEIEAAYSVNSLEVRPNDYVSFRVLVPIQVDGVTVIDKQSLVTGRVVEAKRGGHWGKAGKLSWSMVDVVAVDLTRVPVQAQQDLPNGNRISGTSHGGRVATEMIVFGALLWPIAPVVLMSGFKRGENAVLPQGKRFIVFVKSDTVVRAAAER